MEQTEVREPTNPTMQSPAPTGHVHRLPTWLLMLMVASFVPGSLLIGSMAGPDPIDGATSPWPLLTDTAWLLLFVASGWLLYRRSPIAGRRERMLFVGFAIVLLVLSLGTEGAFLLYGEAEVVWFLAQRPALLDRLEVVVGLLYLIELGFVLRLLWLGTLQLRGR